MMARLKVVSECMIFMACSYVSAAIISKSFLNRAMVLITYAVYHLIINYKQINLQKT